MSFGIQASPLLDTGVTPGSYTATNLTVDSKGRLTAASNGSASLFTDAGAYVYLTTTTDHFLIGTSTDRTAKFVIAGYDRTVDFAQIIHDGTGDIFRIGSEAAGNGKIEVLNTGTVSVKLNANTNSISYINTGTGAGSHFIVGAATSSGTGAQMEIYYDRATQYGLQIADGTGILAWIHSDGGAGDGALILANSGTAAIKLRTATSSFSYFPDNGTVFGAATIDASSVVEVTSTTKGFRITPMTATQASAITPSEGLIVNVSNTNGTFLTVGFWGYQGGLWVKM